MITIKKINNEAVGPIPTVPVDPRPALGYKLFPEPYCNVFLCAKKKSGKTSAIYHIITKCANKKTQVIAFVGSLNKDKNWIAIKEYCEKKGIPFEGHTSLKENGVDLLEELVLDLLADAEAEEKAKEDAKYEEPKPNFEKLIHEHNTVGDENDIVKYPNKKKKKDKFIIPEYIIILDDLSNELKSTSLVTLIKKNRHFKAKVIISSQYYLDLKPESRTNIDYYLIFAHQTIDKLEGIHKDSDMTVPFDLFLKLYTEATQQKYQFLYVDATNEKFRIGFSREFDIRDNN